MYMAYRGPYRLAMHMACTAWCGAAHTRRQRVGQRVGPRVASRSVSRIDSGFEIWAECDEARATAGHARSCQRACGSGAGMAHEARLAASSPTHQPSAPPDPGPPALLHSLWSAPDGRARQRGSTAATCHTKHEHRTPASAAHYLQAAHARLLCSCRARARWIECGVEAHHRRARARTGLASSRKRFVTKGIWGTRGWLTGPSRTSRTSEEGRPIRASECPSIAALASRQPSR